MANLKSLSLQHTDHPLTGSDVEEEEEEEEMTAWSSLPSDIIEAIVERVAALKDLASLHQTMLTCKQMRRMAHQHIHAAVIKSPECMARFPRGTKLTKLQMASVDVDATEIMTILRCISSLLPTLFSHVSEIAVVFSTNDDQEMDEDEFSIEIDSSFFKTLAACCPKLTTLHLDMSDLVPSVTWEEESRPFIEFSKVDFPIHHLSLRGSMWPGVEPSHISDLRHLISLCIDHDLITSEMLRFLVSNCPSMEHLSCRTLGFDEEDLISISMTRGCKVSLRSLTMKYLPNYLCIFRLGQALSSALPSDFKITLRPSGDMESDGDENKGGPDWTVAPLSTSDVSSLARACSYLGEWCKETHPNLFRALVDLVIKVPSLIRGSLTALSPLLSLGLRSIRFAPRSVIGSATLEEIASSLPGICSLHFPSHLIINQSLKFWRKMHSLRLQQLSISSRILLSSVNRAGLRLFLALASEPLSLYIEYKKAAEEEEIEGNDGEDLLDPDIADGPDVESVSVHGYDGRLVEELRRLIEIELPSFLPKGEATKVKLHEIFV